MSRNVWLRLLRGDRRRSATLLAEERYWDAVVLRQPTPPQPIDAGLAAAIHRVHAIDDAPDPDPAFTARLERDLLQRGLSAPAPPAAATPRGAGLVMGHAFALPPAILPRVLAQAATAALLAITLAAVVTTLLWMRAPRATPSVTPVAFIVAAPENAIATETLVDEPVASLPFGHAIIGVDRWVLQPSSTPLTLPAFGGPAVIAVDMGEVLLTLGDPPEIDSRVRRLASGEAMTPASDQTASLEVVGANDVVAFVVYASKAFEGQFTENDPTAHTFDSLIATTAERLPGGPGRIVLERLTLPTGSTLPPERARPFEWIAVGSGVLGLRLEGTGLPPGWQSGDERIFQAGEALPSVAPDTQTTVRNVGDDPLVLYRLTIVPD